MTSGPDRINRINQINETHNTNSTVTLLNTLNKKLVEVSHMGIKDASPIVKHLVD